MRLMSFIIACRHKNTECIDRQAHKLCKLAFSLVHSLYVWLVKIKTAFINFWISILEHSKFIARIKDVKLDYGIFINSPLTHTVLKFVQVLIL